MAPRKRNREEDENQVPGSDDSVRSVRSRVERSSSSSAASDVDALQLSESKASETSTTATEQSDEESELSSSSEEPSDESESSESEDEGSATEDERTTIIPQSKRVMKPSQIERDSALELRMKLKKFLPQMEAANRDLEAARLDGSLEERSIEKLDEDAEEQYIEMDLGLGVLEHTNGAQDEEEDSGDDADTERDAARGGDASVMDTLLRRNTTGRTAVTVVEDDT